MDKPYLVAPGRPSEFLFAGIFPAIYVLSVFGMQMTWIGEIRGVLNFLIYVFPVVTGLVFWTWICRGGSMQKSKLRLLVRDHLFFGSLFAVTICLGTFVLLCLIGALSRAPIPRSISDWFSIFVVLTALFTAPLGAAIMCWRRFREAASGTWRLHGASYSVASLLLFCGLWIGLPLSLHHAAKRVGVEAVAALELGSESERTEALTRLDRWNYLISIEWMIHEFRLQTSSPNRREALSLALERLTGQPLDRLMD